MKKLDQDGNGQVDFLEFVTFMIDGQAVIKDEKADASAPEYESTSSDDICTAAFSIFDADKDGLISPSDLRWSVYYYFRMVNYVAFHRMENIAMNFSDKRFKNLAWILRKMKRKKLLSLIVAFQITTWGNIFAKSTVTMLLNWPHKIFFLVT